MSSIADKKNEIDLVRSVFTPEELIFDDPMIIKEFDLMSPENIEDKDVNLTLKIAFPDLSITVVLTICLPRGYPNVRPSVLMRVPQSTCIINEKALNTSMHEWLNEACASREPIICALVDWLRAALDEENWDPYLGRDAFKNASAPGEAKSQEGSSGSSNRNSNTSTQITEPEICYWIFSHHIRNPKKRKVIVDWSRELGLTGCCLPGKPGIIVVEGPEDKVEEYWKRIRVLTWKRIQVKDREVIAQRRFSDGFFEVGGTLAEKIGYMRGHGVTQERIAQHFGFKADHDRKSDDEDGDDEDD